LIEAKRNGGEIAWMARGLYYNPSRLHQGIVYGWIWRTQFTAMEDFLESFESSPCRGRTRWGGIGYWRARVE